MQALIYPVLQALDFNTPSYQQNMNTPILPRYVMVKYWVDYFNDSYDFVQAMIVNNHTSLDVDRASALRARLNWTGPFCPLPSQRTISLSCRPLAAPGLSRRSLSCWSAMAPSARRPGGPAAPLKTYILTCEHDVLRDDGIMYAKRWRVQAWRWPWITLRMASTDAWFYQLAN